MTKGLIDRFRLDGRRSLVTGAGQGLGRAFALALAEAGADVAVADKNEESCQRTAADIRAVGRRSVAITADISSTSDITAMVEEALSVLGGLDIAVNNAAISLPIKDALDITEEEWDRQLNVNLKGTFFCAQAEAAAMKPNGYGKIINIASICGHIVWPEAQALYSISKAGVIHLTRCLAAEWIKHGIRVNSISPGVTRTPELFPEVIPVFLKTAPIDHIGETQDHLAAILYLASEASDFMTGHDMVIDGGYTVM